MGHLGCQAELCGRDCSDGICAAIGLLWQTFLMSPISHRRGIPLPKSLTVLGHVVLHTHLKHGFPSGKEGFLPADD